MSQKDTANLGSWNPTCQGPLAHYQLPGHDTEEKTFSSISSSANLQWSPSQCEVVLGACLLCSVLSPYCMSCEHKHMPHLFHFPQAAERASYACPLLSVLIVLFSSLKLKGAFQQKESLHWSYSTVLLFWFCLL